MRSHFSCVKAVMLSAAMLLTSAAVPYAVMNDPSSAIITASAASSTYTIEPNQTVDYSKLPEDDKMIGWEWSEFGIPASEKVTKVEMNISASKAIGKWQGAFGTSTTVSPDYWTQTDEMEQKISGTSGTITWNVDSATSKIIQYGYGGELKWGIWWVDCGTFTIDSIKVTTDGSGSAETTTTTTKTPAVTTAPSSTDTNAYTIKPNETIDYSKLPEDDKMIGWEWSEFGIPASEKVTKVEISISASKAIGKWQGAFGTSTTVSPEYWTQTDEMEQKISGTSGTITWNVDSATSKIIQYGYGGELKWGIWWIDCGTFTIDSIKVYTDGSSSATTTTKTPDVTTTPKVTTTKTNTITKAPDVTTSPSTDGNAYTIKPNETIDYSKLPEDDKMIGWEWSEFGIPASEKVTKVEINISASKAIGKWQGAFGTSTTVSPEYWTQTDEMEQKISGTSGTITWNVDSATSKIIQYGYGGELKWGIWWIDCGTFTIDSIKVYTDGSSSATTTTKTPDVTTTPKVTTTKTNTITKAPDVTTSPSTDGKSYVIKPNEDIDYSKLPEDDRMIGWEWSEFGIPANEKVTKVEISISASKAIGKWQGAFGTSTTVSPEYWTQTDEMEQKISGTSGTITWNVDSATSKIIQYGYGGELKWGIWWIDCGTFTIDSIKVYTDGSSSATTTTKTPDVTTTPKVTTTKTTTTTKTPEVTTTPAVTTMVTTTSKAAVSSSDATSGGDVKPTLIGDITGDGDIDVRDVTLLNQYIVKLADLDAQQMANADIIKDGKIDLKDLGQLKKYLIKVIDSLE